MLPTNQKCHLSWFTAGPDPDTGIWPEELQKANTIIISQDECIEYWGNTIYDGHVCIFQPQPGITSCSVSLTENIVSLETLDIFKGRLDKHWSTEWFKISTE